MSSELYWIGESHREEDALAIHPPYGQETESDDHDGIQQRRESRKGNVVKPALKDYFLPAERSAQHFGDDVGGNGIRPKDEKGLAPPAAVLLDVHRPVADRKTNQSESRGEHDVRTGPQLLVEGKPDAPGFAGDQSRDAEAEHPGGLALAAAAGAQPLAGQHAA